MFKQVGNCITCGKKTQIFCDGCKAYICEVHSLKPLANKEIILCKNCWENKDEILNKMKNKMKKHSSVIDESNVFDAPPYYP